MQKETVKKGDNMLIKLQKILLLKNVIKTFQAPTLLKGGAKPRVLILTLNLYPQDREGAKCAH